MAKKRVETVGNYLTEMNSLNYAKNIRDTIVYDDFTPDDDYEIINSDAKNSWLRKLVYGGRNKDRNVFIAWILAIILLLIAIFAVDEENQPLKTLLYVVSGVVIFIAFVILILRRLAYNGFVLSL